MKYLSKDPEEWKKKEQQFLQREREQTRRYRRQGIYFLILNVVIVLIFFFGLRMYYGQFPSQRTEINQLIIQVETPYVSGTSLDVKVRLYNNQNKPREVVISNFTLQILSNEGPVYSFSQKDSVRTTLDAFASRLLFDLRRESELTSLRAGEYTIVVKTKVDDQEVYAQKSFVSTEKYQILVEGLLDFYLVGESMKTSIYLVNNTATVRDLQIQYVKLFLKENEQIVWQKEFPVQSKWPEVGIGKDVRVVDQAEFAFDHEGKYILTVQSLVNGSITSVSLPVMCVRDYEKDLKKVKIYSDVPKQINVREQVAFSAYLQNTTNKDLFLMIDQIDVNLPPSTLSYQRRSVRVWLDPYSQYEIFKFLPWNTSAMTRPGVYKLIVKVLCGSDSKYFESSIQVID
ncbi:MAG TPA: hypothetical protein PLP64_01560 [Pseudothermotoga sp.]|nr:hypothetical protein [Pseudothermotoga sp.]HOK82897.1 hypothetical protein [Pseudothermotoga sp.]HPP69930.1 hypothetical protein [Pseudothermotoga sp.]